MSVWIRMYCAKQRASLPFVIDLPAAEQLGNETPVRPAFVASALINVGVMSGVPVIFSWLRLELTVERLVAPSAMIATPNRTSTAPR